MSFTVQRMDDLPNRHKLKWLVYNRGRLVAAFKSDHAADAYVMQQRIVKRRQTPEHMLDDLQFMEHRMGDDK